MPDTIDAIMDAAVPSIPDAGAEKPSASANGLSGTPAPKTAPSGSAATPGSGDAPTRTATTEAPTTAVPASDGKPSQADPDELSADEQKRGVPVERHTRIVQNARDRERVATETRVYESEIGYSKDEYGTLKPYVDALANDLPRFYRMIEPQLKRFGLVPNGNGHTAQPEGQQPPAKVVAERPQPDSQSEDGRKFYSEKAMEALSAWERQQILAEVDARLKPHNETRAALERQTVDSQAREYAATTIAEASQWEGFEELKPQIVKAMKADGRVTIQSAYLKFHPAWRKEQDKKLETTIRQKQLDEIAAKPKPPNDVRPSAAPVGSRTKTRRSTLDSKLDEAAAGLYT